MTRAGPNRSVGLVLVAALASFTANLDLSIVNLALPVIGRAFGVSQSELAWTVNAYVLPYAVSILAVGRLADRFGHRSVIVWGAVLFTVGSVVSAVAPGYGVLLAGRVMQGLGGSALLTVGLAIISASFAGAERGRALGLYFASGASAAVVGPIVGGLLTSVDPSTGVRLLGVSVSGLADQATRQLTLDDAAEADRAGGGGDEGSRWSEASYAMDRIRERFGSSAIGPASVVGERGLRVKRTGDQQWGPGAEGPAAEGPAAEGRGGGDGQS